MDVGIVISKQHRHKYFSRVLAEIERGSLHHHRMVNLDWLDGSEPVVCWKDCTHI